MELASELKMEARFFTKNGYMQKSFLSQHLKDTFMDQDKLFNLLWNSMGKNALAFFPPLPSPTKLAPENERNSSSSSSDVPHFSPRRMAQPALTPLPCRASLTWAESEHGCINKAESCPRDQLLRSADHPPT